MAPTAGQGETPTGTSTTNSTGTETGQEEQQGQQQQTAPETGVQGQQQQGQATEEPAKLPDDHPLVKTLATQKDTISSLKQELAEARAQAGKTTTLEAELKERPTKEAVETLQKRYDRLEAFLQGAGGTLGKALDSRTFTKRLFETEDKISDIVKDWNKDNPSATTTALGGGTTTTSDGKPSMNELLRAAAKG